MTKSSDQLAVEPVTAPVRGGGAAASIVTTERDPTPFVLWLAALLRRSTGPAGGSVKLPAPGTVVTLNSVTDRQKATLRFADTGVRVEHGAASNQDVALDVDLTDKLRLDGAPEAAGMISVLQGLLRPQLPAWDVAARWFWTLTGNDPGMPARLVVRSGDAELPLGTGLPRYEMTGTHQTLAEVFTGQLLLLDALKSGRLRVRGTFPQLSIMVGASWKARWNA